MKMLNKVLNWMKIFYNQEKYKILKIKLYKRQMIIQKIKIQKRKKIKLKIYRKMFLLKMNQSQKKINNRILIINN